MYVCMYVYIYTHIYIYIYIYKCEYTYNLYSYMHDVILIGPILVLRYSYMGLVLA